MHHVARRIHSKSSEIIRYLNLVKYFNDFNEFLLFSNANKAAKIEAPRHSDKIDVTYFVGLESVEFVSINLTFHPVLFEIFPDKLVVRVSFNVSSYL